MSHYSCKWKKFVVTFHIAQISGILHRTGMLLMDAKTCIQMEKNCHDIFVAYSLEKCRDKFLPFTTVVAHVIGTYTTKF